MAIVSFECELEIRASSLAINANHSDDRIAEIVTLSSGHDNKGAAPLVAVFRRRPGEKLCKWIAEFSIESYHATGSIIEMEIILKNRANRRRNIFGVNEICLPRRVRGIRSPRN